MIWPLNKTRPLEVKENPVGRALFSTMPLSYTAPNKRDLAREGYERNIIVYRAIREIVNGCADIDIEIKQNGEVLDDQNHPALLLLARPNPMQGFNQFIKNIFTDYLITGDMFITRYPNNSTKAPLELWSLNPLDTSVKAGKQGMPDAFIFAEKTKNEKVFRVNPIDGKSDVFHLKTYNPLDYWRGLAPLQAAALAGDTHNIGMIWNYSLLKNGARPSGIVEFSDTPSGEVINRLKEFFKRQMQGSKNAGEIPVLTGGAKWTSVDTNPRDMDYIQTMREMAKYIASAFGVPLPLIDNDSASYNNMEQAKERLWTDTIVPLFDEFLNAFGAWLLPVYGENLEFCANLDSIQALEGVRTRKFERMVKSIEKGLLTIDEARREVGFPPVGGIAESLLVPSGLIPVELSNMDVPDDEKALAIGMYALGYSKEEIKNALAGKD